jgi:sulfite reductase (NADPH) hemoprotein beta-component
MDALAGLADDWSFGQLRATHDQNLVLCDVPQRSLRELWRALDAQRLATPNIGTLTDMICCPGLDFCSLANAGSIPIAKQIHERFDDFDYLYELGPIEIKMSGCMNACGHHHIGHIGILGVDKHGQEWYQITLGGSSAAPAALGEVIGPSVPKSEVADTIGRILEVYVRERRSVEEHFLDTVRRIGVEPFQERVYATDHSTA